MQEGWSSQTTEERLEARKLLFPTLGRLTDIYRKYSVTDD
jgi:hypothetical protein